MHVDGDKVEVSQEGNAVKEQALLVSPRLVPLHSIYDDLWECGVHRLVVLNRHEGARELAASFALERALFRTRSTQRDVCVVVCAHAKPRVALPVLECANTLLPSLRYRSFLGC